MDAISYSDAEKNLAQTMQKVCDDHEPVVITREHAAAVVMIALEDYQGLEETAHLLRSPENAKRLLESIVELDGGGIERDLVE